MMTRTLYGLKPSVVFEASVYILRQNVAFAKDIVTGKLNTFHGVNELLGPSTDNHDNIVLSWMDGNNHFVPHNIDHFFERAFLQMYLLCPEMLTFLGFLEQAGIKNHNGWLQDSPSEHHEKLLRYSNEYLLFALNNTNQWNSLTPEQKISRNILKWSIEHSNRYFRDQIYSLEQLDGCHSFFYLLMSDFAIIESMSDVELYKRCLEQAEMKFNLVVCDMKKKREMGVMPPKICLKKIDRSITGIIKNLKDENNDFITAVKSKYKSSTNKDLPKEITDQLNTKIHNSVIPAYSNLLYEVNVCIEQATDDAGVWKLPKGDEFYKHCLKWQTTTNLSAEQIHQLGLDNVKNLLNNVQHVISELNGKGDNTLYASNTIDKNLKTLAEDEMFLYQDTKEDRVACIREYEHLLSEITKIVSCMFNIVPSSKCMIKPMPKSMGEGGAGACYFPGSLDLSRPGMFYANLTNIKSQNKSQMRTLTAHEAVPGHHFQCSLQLENKKLPYFRRCTEGLFTAYVEGWGLYAEYIGNETGFYNDSDGCKGYSVLGYYCAELLRSSRLVVDTGIHKMKWTRQQAIDYMIANTGMTKQEAEDEVDRYCVLPGQACAYKIGQLKILEIRNKLEKKPEFDIRSFHDKVLEIGPVPLDILEEILLDN